GPSVGGGEAQARQPTADALAVEHRQQSRLADAAVAEDADALRPAQALGQGRRRGRGPPHEGTSGWEDQGAILYILLRWGCRKMEKPGPGAKKGSAMPAILHVPERTRKAPPGWARPSRGEDGQEERPAWAGTLMAVLLAVLVGLFAFAHGCGQHDHDD